MTAAAESTHRATDLYTGGFESYFDVVQAQNIELAARLSDADIRTRRMTASVLLIKALGGGWERSELEPSRPGQSEVRRTEVRSE